MRLRFLAPACFVLASLGTMNEARAAIPIIWGHGPTIAKVADLPAGHPAIAMHGAGTAVGFKYERFHIYWCDLWTWGGEFCFYNDLGFEPLGADEKKAAETAGMKALSKPLLYHFPLGWVLIAAFVFGAVALDKVKKGNAPDARVEKLLRDENYQEAAKLIESRPDGKERALDHLIGRGIDPGKAAANVNLLVAHIRRATQSQASASDEPLESTGDPINL